MFQNVSGFHEQNFSGFRIHIPVTYILSAHLFCCGFRKKKKKLVVLDSLTVSGFRKKQVETANISGIRKICMRNPQM